jgi:hypothetical protein
MREDSALSNVGSVSRSIPNTSVSLSAAMRLAPPLRVRGSATVVAEPSSAASSTSRSVKNSAGFASRRMPTP